MELSIGVDISKLKFDVYCQEVFLEFSNDKKGITKFMGYLKKLATEHQIKAVIYEPTGGYEKALEMGLKESNFPRHKAHANKVRSYAASKGILAKTDRLDAKLLSQYGQDNPCRMDVVEKTEQEEELQALVTRRDQLLDEKIRETNRLDKPLKPVLQKSIKRHIKWLEEEIDDLEQAIKHFFSSQKAVAKLAELYQSVKGVGLIIATRLITDLPELGKREHKALSALVGLAPMNHDSGKLRARRSIKGGRHRVRTALYMSALTAIRCNEPLKNFYQRLKTKGKPTKVAIVAVMHKLLHILNSIAKRKTPWVLNY